MARKKESWLADQLYFSSRLFNGGQAYLSPCGLKELKDKADKHCWRGTLARDQAGVLHRKLTAMGKEFDGRVEMGFFEYSYGRGRSAHTYGWPYGAVATFEGGKLKQGFVIVPCAFASPWISKTTITLPDRKVQLHSPILWNPLTPTLRPVEGSRSQRVAVPLEQIADRNTVRPGDSAVLDLSACPLLRVMANGIWSDLGSAVSYGSMDEMIDSVRCRIVFGLLPSA